MGPISAAQAADREVRREVRLVVQRLVAVTVQEASQAAAARTEYLRNLLAACDVLKAATESFLRKPNVRMALCVGDAQRERQAAGTRHLSHVRIAGCVRAPPRIHRNAIAFSVSCVVTRLIVVVLLPDCPNLV